MISIKHNFLFIHIPKTGGNSIQTYLSEFSEDSLITKNFRRDGVRKFQVVNRKYGTIKHSTINDYKKKIEKNIFDSLFKFTVIRNPWDRMISFYFSPHKTVPEWNREKFRELISHKLTLRDFICTESLGDKINRTVKMSIFPNRKSIDSEIDFILRFENLNNDFRELCSKLDIPYQNLPHINQSKRNHYSKYYDEELNDIIKSRFSEEIELGQYRFERG